MAQAKSALTKRPAMIQLYDAAGNPLTVRMSDINLQNEPINSQPAPQSGNPWMPPAYSQPPADQGGGDNSGNDECCLAFGGPAVPRYYEANLPPNACRTGYQLAETPEALLAVGHVDYKRKASDRDRALPSWLATSKKGSIINNNSDYNMVGTVAQFKAVLKQLFSLGAYATTTQAGVAAGNNFVITLPAGLFGMPCIGFRLRWGVQLLNYAPFEMPIASSGFKTLFPTAAPQPVDRTFTVTVSGSNGGVIYVPLAQRFLAPGGGGGMSMAQNVVGAATDPTTITIGPLDPAVLTAFSASAQLITAFHPNAASFAYANGVLAGPPNKADYDWIYSRI